MSTVTAAPIESAAGPVAAVSSGMVSVTALAAAAVVLGLSA